MGPMYGHQWRHAGAKYEGCDDDYTEQGIDQLQKVIDDIKKSPHSRRLLINTWSVTELKEMCLSPCHFAVQFKLLAEVDLGRVGGLLHQVRRLNPE